MARREESNRFSDREEYARSRSFEFRWSVAATVILVAFIGAVLREAYPECGRTIMTAATAIVFAIVSWEYRRQKGAGRDGKR